MIFGKKWEGFFVSHSTASEVQPSSIMFERLQTSLPADKRTLTFQNKATHTNTIYIENGLHIVCIWFLFSTFGTPALKKRLFSHVIVIWCYPQIQMINFTTRKSRTELSLAVQTGKRRDKAQITVPLMGGGGNGDVMLRRCADVWHSSRFSQKNKKNPGSEWTWTLSEGFRCGCRRELIHS